MPGWLWTIDLSPGSGSYLWPRPFYFFYWLWEGHARFYFYMPQLLQCILFWCKPSLFMIIYLQCLFTGKCKNECIYPKIFLLTNKYSNPLAASNFSDFLKPRILPWTFRSTGQLLLKPSPNINLVSKVKPKLWNALSPHIRLSPTLPVFKTNLKTRFLTRPERWRLSFPFLLILVFLAFYTLLLCLLVF